MGLSEEQIQRYSRNILLGEVGGRGQQRLLESRALVIGAGGLGCPAALYLAAAGVGTLGIADFDTVDRTNLQRQIGHRTADVGRPKSESLADSVRRLNPGIEVRSVGRIVPGNAPFADFDVVLDGSDNFATRFLVNDEAVRLGVPLVTGAVLRFEGQLTVVIPGEGRPCWRCLYPGPPAPGAVPTCAQAGVLGSVAGTIGALMATETVKVLLGAGEALAGRLLLHDALAGEFRTVGYGRDPACPAHPGRLKAGGTTADI